MTQEQKQEFTRRISQENHTGLILVLCDIFHTYGNDAIARMRRMTRLHICRISGRRGVRCRS